MISQISAGSCGFENCRKSTPHATQVAIGKMMKGAVENHGVKFLEIIVKGIGMARDMLSLFSNYGINIESIEDITNPSYNGCTNCRARRV